MFQQWLLFDGSMQLDEVLQNYDIPKNWLFDKKVYISTVEILATWFVCSVKNETLEKNNIIVIMKIKYTKFNIWITMDCNSYIYIILTMMVWMTKNLHPLEYHV